LLYIIVGVVILIAAAAVIAYWQLIVAEGAYLGSCVVALLYDWFAPRYDGVKQFDPTSDAVMLAEPVLRHLNAMAADAPVVLDVATGTGRLLLALMLQPAFTGRIIAIDVSKKMLDIAQAKLNAYADRIEWQCDDAQRLKFEDDTFDVVTSLEALEFFNHPKLALSEMIRVLRPGGLLMVSNRIGPDAWKLPGKAMPTYEFIKLLESLGVHMVRREDWLVDYDLVVGIKSGDAR
jgi:ubiquinone/menaquinone biosynthesis C-methylase UbiE